MSKPTCGCRGCAIAFQEGRNDYGSRFVCARCGTLIELLINEQSGEWWVHAEHPEDGHDALPQGVGPALAEAVAFNDKLNGHALINYEQGRAEALREAREAVAVAARSTTGSVPAILAAIDALAARQAPEPLGEEASDD